MTHYNQTNVPILSRFRTEDNLNATNNMNQKYNGHSNSNTNIANNQYQANVPTYTPSTHLQANSDDKQRLNNSYQQNSSSANSTLQQNQPEITHDICNVLLNQQTDAKRGTACVFLYLPLKISTSN